MVFSKRKDSGASRRVGNSQGRHTLNFYRSKPRQPARAVQASSLVGRVKSASLWLTSRITLVALVGAFLYLVVGSGTNLNVVVGSAAYRPPSAYQQVVAAHVSRLKDSTKITFDSDSITSALYAAFPEVVSASVELPLASRTPVVRVDIAAPEFQFVSGTGSALAIGSNGKLVGSASKPALSGLAQVKDQSGLKFRVGDQIFSSQQIAVLDNFLVQLKHANYVVNYVGLPAVAQEVDVHLKQAPYYIKVNLAGNGAGEVGSYLATAHYLSTHHIKAHDYIDVRVSGKVFYK